MLYGILVCLLTGLFATWLGGLQHIVGAPMIGLFLGILISNLAPKGFVAATKKGAGYSSKYLLKLGIILAGGTLSFHEIVGVGLSTLPIIIFNVCLSFLVALLVGRRLGVSGKTGTLVGGGTAICGGTAIATLTPIIDADEEDMAYAMTAIFLFDIFAALAWPYAAVALGLTPAQYGVLGGLAISDTASVTAAAGTFDMLSGAAAGALSGGAMSIINKLTRTTMLIVVALVVMLIKLVRDGKSGHAAKAGEDKPSFGRSLVKAFPLFVLGFLAMAILNTFFDLGSINLFSGMSLGKLCKIGYKYLIAVALVGVGYKIRIKDIFVKGAKPVLLGGITWAAIAVSTLLYVTLLM